MSPAPPSSGLQWRRLPLLLLGALGLGAGLWAGLARLGVGSPLVTPLAHGPLMVSGFLGTVISLERAVAARKQWAYLGPLSCGLGTLAFVLGQPGPGAVERPSGWLRQLVCRQSSRYRSGLCRS